MTPKETFEKLVVNIMTGKLGDENKELLPTVEKALTELEELKQEIKDRQETENSLTQWVADLTTELEELKRYPTSEEVCEAIQSELPYGTVKYIEGNQEFVFLNHGEQSNITDVYGDRYKVTGFYKSPTLSLIGRFYEGVEKK